MGVLETRTTIQNLNFVASTFEAIYISGRDHNNAGHISLDINKQIHYEI